jgi:hypothetical protein
MIAISKGQMLPIYETWVDQYRLMQRIDKLNVEVPTEVVRHDPNLITGAVWIERDDLHFVDMHKDVRRIPIEWRE